MGSDEIVDGSSALKIRELFMHFSWCFVHSEGYLTYEIEIKIQLEHVSYVRN